MRKKISKKFIAYLISATLLIALGYAFACADYDYDSDFYNSFFAPETSNTPESQPFYRSIQPFYKTERLGDAINIMDNVNIGEWTNFFENKVSSEDLWYIVYKSSITEIDDCIFYLKNSSHPISGSLKSNSLLAYENKALTREFLFYLGFAKRCEPFAVYIPENWWDEERADDPKKDKALMEKHLAGGKKAIVSIKSSYIKERYAFQITRLLFNMGKYQECINYYDENSALFTSKSSMLYRTLGYVAASNYRLKKYSEANYLYSLIFDKCEPMRMVSFISFHPQEEQDWNGSLALAKSDQERATLWHLLGIYVDPLRAMKEIYKLDPKSKYLDLLITRAVNINEEAFIPCLSCIGTVDSMALQAKQVDEKLFEFAEQLAKAGNTNKPYLWNLVAGYLNLAKGNLSQAERYFSHITLSSKQDNLIQDQVKAFRVMIKIEQYLKPDPKTEEVLTKDLQWLKGGKRDEALRSEPLYTWALKRLSQKYGAWGESVKAQCLNYQRNPYYYDDQNSMQQLILLMDKPQKTNFEKYILSLFPYSRNTLFSYMAKTQLYKYNFSEALAILKKSPGAGMEANIRDPFRVHIRDCYDCYEENVEEIYSQYSFIEKLIELQMKAIMDKSKAHEYYFLMANGLYNMTYFGNSRELYQSPIRYYGQIYFSWSTENELLRTPYVDCSKAMEFYLKAMNATTDKEFKAKCCFMAAKCEQNRYFISNEFDYGLPVRSGVYFNQLYDEFSGTDYYKEVINECGYFRTFVAKKSRVQL